MRRTQRRQGDASREPRPAAPGAEASQPEGRAERSADELLASIAGGLAHEIKNPLGVMSLNLQLLREDLRDAATARERALVRRLETVQQQVRRLEEILQDFLRFTTASELEREPCGVKALVEDVLRFLEPELRRGRVRVQTFFEADLPEIPLDRRLIHQALLNILLNAKQAMEARGGGDLFVHTSRSPEGVQLEIIDTGVGMTADIARRAFDLYYSTKREGSGLGLPTVRRIVERHGGTIEMESEPERGTRVRMRFPAVQRDPREGAASAAARDSRGPGVAPPSPGESRPEGALGEEG